MVRAIERYEAAGHRGQFVVRPEGRIKCLQCRQESDAARFKLLAATRIDVAADPGDQAIVAALECPTCTKTGTVTFAYGPSASAEDAEAILHLRDERGVISTKGR